MDCMFMVCCLHSAMLLAPEHLVMAASLHTTASLSHAMQATHTEHVSMKRLDVQQ